MIVESLFKSIYRGKNGLNKGISSGFERLDKVTFGIQRKYFYTIGGDSGSGKSTFAIYKFVYKPLIHAINNQVNVNFLYFSFEMSQEVLFAKLLSLHLYDKYDKVVSYEQILSLTSEIPKKTLNLIEESKGWLIEVEKRLTIVDKPVNADGLYAITKDWSKNYGEFREISEHKEEYYPKDPSQYLIVLVDHIRLLRNNGDVKAQIDRACDYLVYFRNKCDITVVVIQQLNRGFKSSDRRAGGVYQLLQTDDFADSSSPVQSSEIVFGLFHAFREKMSKCEKYDIKKLNDRFRLCQVLKSRYGMSDKNIGLNFFGEIGYWKELPLPEDINDYEKFTELKIESSNTKIDEKKEEDVIKYEFRL